jgi:hypothetical protein
MSKLTNFLLFFIIVIRLQNNAFLYYYSRVLLPFPFEVLYSRQIFIFRESFTIIDIIISFFERSNFDIGVLISTRIRDRFAV